MEHPSEKNLQNIIQNTKTFSEIHSGEMSLSLLHVSDMIEVGLVTEGKGIHRILGETIECAAGDIYIVGGGVPHGYFALSEQDFPTVQTLSFSADECLLGEYADIGSSDYCYGVFRDNSLISYAMLSSKALNEILNILDMLKKELTNKKERWQTAAHSYLILLLITVSRYINMAQTQTPMRSKEWAAASEAVRAVLERYSDSELTLESIATSLYMSKSRLSRIFQKEIGESFLDYVRNVRINKACSLLKNTTLTNEEIVRNCGLKDIPSFYRVFKTVVGQTPYQYRMSHSAFNRLSREEATTSILNDICDNMQIGKNKNVKNLVELAINAGIPPKQILNDGLLKGMSIVGVKFKKNEIYVPEVLLAARSMNESISLLKSVFKEDINEFKGRVCIGTVQGDLHDIGKNLVKMMMEARGLEVIDLGTDVSPETYVNAAIENNCSVICCSALLTTTMGVIEEVVKLTETAGIRNKVKILIGGAPVTEEFCKKIGADLYTPDAATAAEAALEFCSTQLSSNIN